MSGLHRRKRRGGRESVPETQSRQAGSARQVQGGLLLGSNTKALLKRTERPALVVRGPEDRIEDDA